MNLVIKLIFYEKRIRCIQFPSLFFFNIPFDEVEPVNLSTLTINLDLP